MTRSKRATPIVYLYDDMMVFNCAFGRQLDSEGVTAFSVAADDRALQIAIRIYKNGEENQLSDAVHEAQGIFPLRPNGLGRNAGRRVNIAYVQKDRGWLQKDMTGQTEAERRRIPVFDARDNAFVLKAAD